MTKTFCDRCGTENNVQSVGVSSPVVANKLIHYDLCGMCRSALDDFFKPLPVAKNVD